MDLLAIPAFADNYIWVLHDGQHALAIDPGEAGPVRQVLQKHGLTLEVILVTHHHADHTGGVAALREQTRAQVYGPATEAIPQPAIPLSEGQHVHWRGLALKVYDVPGHTAGHIAYFGGLPDQAPWLFCGDTLFSGGCGRLFEGTPAQMLASLDKLAALPDDALVCAAHEYTLSNLAFARAVEPGNPDVIQYQAACVQRRNSQQPTLPSQLGRERQINPFLRSRQPSVKDAVRAHDASTAPDDVAVFAALRQWKNDYK